MKQFDVLVVGGGHAGTEAAAAAARRGALVALVSQSLRMIGVMSCNPSIGGLGKGHLVREVDAMDGLMAVAADAAGLHYRMLNRSRGMAVQGPRVQADRRLYRRSISEQLATYKNISLIEAEVVDLSLKNGAVCGVSLGNDGLIKANAVVLATGTFLRGRMFRGSEREEGGRIGERAASRLGERLEATDLPLQRLKTGTPPRLDGRTIDWGKLQSQPSDDDDWRMSPVTAGPRLPQLACAIARTNLRTHDIVRNGLLDSPLFSGAIEGSGPRYCPSIEDKVHRFGDRDGHQVFLEPEGLDDLTVYPNGISTSLATPVQEALIRSIGGLERCVITAPGYAVEYDYLDPRALDHRLAIRQLPGVFCAGQLNGTTGYEEAAAQGVIAGFNAAAYALGLEPALVDRAMSYTGVMIDDLVLQGVNEPYRMLTARAEYRLALRADNAGSRLGLWAAGLGALRSRRLVFNEERAMLRRKVEAGLVARDAAPLDLVREIDEDERYAPYLVRQAEEIARMRRDAGIAIAQGEALRLIPGLSNEMIERLLSAAPQNLGEAARVRGVTPAALSTLWLHARRA